MQVAWCSLTCTVVKENFMLRDFLMSISRWNYFGFLCYQQSEVANVPSILRSLCSHSVLCTAIFDSVLRMCFRCVMPITTLWRTDSTSSFCYYEPSNNTNLADLKGNMFWSWYLWFGSHFFGKLCLTAHQEPTPSKLSCCIVCVAWFCCVVHFFRTKTSPKMGGRGDQFDLHETAGLGLHLFTLRMFRSSSWRKSSLEKAAGVWKPGRHRKDSWTRPWKGPCGEEIAMLEIDIEGRTLCGHVWPHFFSNLLVKL